MYCLQQMFFLYATKECGKAELYLIMLLSDYLVNFMPWEY